MAETKATPVPTQTKDSAAVSKPASRERKKPVRTAPVQKDYPNKLAWLKALTEHEEAETEKANAAKVARLDKRIASAKVARDEAAAKVTALEAERAALVPAEDEGFDEFEIANGRDTDPA
jgi:hypothetical protein